MTTTQITTHPRITISRDTGAFLALPTYRLLLDGVEVDHWRPSLNDPPAFIPDTIRGHATALLQWMESETPD